MPTYTIAVLPGDGIGPEVVDQALKVLSAAENQYDDIHLKTETYEVGAGLYQRTKTALPEDVFAQCRDADAILFGSCGLPDVRKEDGTEAGNAVQLHLRFRLDLYAGIRPLKLFKGVRSALRTEEKPGIDYVVMRENTEGVFASLDGGARVRSEAVADTSIITRRGTERIVRRAFEEARKRSGAPTDGVSRVTCVDKSNVTPGYAFFRRIFAEVAGEYPDVEPDYAYIDAFSLYLVQRPEYYDVVVAENLFGDIVSDLGAGTVGGLGLAPSGDVGDHHGLFQPSHGSAPDIAGKDRANPLATILSAALMLKWLGEKDGHAPTTDAGNGIERAVERVLAEGRIRTADLGGGAGTNEVGDAVAESLSA